MGEREGQRDDSGTRVYAELVKNKRESVRIAWRTFNGRDYVDIRTHYWSEEGPEEELRPTRKGVSLRLEQLGELREALEAADAGSQRSPDMSAAVTTAARFSRLVETAAIATGAGPEDDVGPYLEGLAAGEHGEGVAALLREGRALMADGAGQPAAAGTLPDGSNEAA